MAFLAAFKAIELMLGSFRLVTKYPLAPRCTSIFNFLRTLILQFKTGDPTLCSERHCKYRDGRGQGYQLNHLFHQSSEPPSHSSTILLRGQTRERRHRSYWDANITASGCRFCCIMGLMQS